MGWFARGDGVWCSPWFKREWGKATKEIREIHYCAFFRLVQKLFSACQRINLRTVQYDLSLCLPETRF